MLRYLFAGTVGTLLFLVALAGMFRVFIQGAVEIDEAYGRALKGDIDAQRRIALCYRTGHCRAVGGFSGDRDPVLGCTWRLIILDEEPAADPTDASEAATDCNALDGRLRRQAEERERELFRLIHHHDPAPHRRA